MGAPQRWDPRAMQPGAEPSTHPQEHPQRKRTSGKGPLTGGSKKASIRWRRFAALVVVPVLLMLGSVYLHAVSTGMSERAAGLEQRLSRAQATEERLEIQVTELSAPERIKSLARERLGMREPGAAALKVYGGDHREDGNAQAQNSREVSEENK